VKCRGRQPLAQASGLIRRAQIVGALLAIADDTAGMNGLMATWHLAPGSLSWSQAAAALAANAVPADGGPRVPASLPGACR
jgi:hypothetical protein